MRTVSVFIENLAPKSPLPISVAGLKVPPPCKPLIGYSPCQSRPLTLYFLRWAGTDGWGPVPSNHLHQPDVPGGAPPPPPERLLQCGKLSGSHTQQNIWSYQINLKTSECWRREINQYLFTICLWLDWVELQTEPSRLWGGFSLLFQRVVVWFDYLNLYEKKLTVRVQQFLHHIFFFSQTAHQADTSLLNLPTAVWHSTSYPLDTERQYYFTFQHLFSPTVQNR